MRAKPTLKDKLTARNPAQALKRSKALEAEQKYDRAFHLAVAAAKAGLPEAERLVGNHYLTGAGTLRNAVEAARWFVRAAEKGDVEAQRHLAALIIFGMPEAALSTNGGSLFTGEHQPQADFPAALRWALPAAEAGDVESQIWAGYIYAAAGEDLRDEAKAEYWFGKAAAEADAPKAHLGLGAILLRKADTDEKTFTAVAHLRKAAEADLPSGHYYLAFIHELGIGVHADPEIAAKHYGEAAKAGIRAAQTKYGYMMLNGIGMKANPVEGETWLRRAGLRGDRDAAALVAGIYAAGNGKLPPSFAEAAHWFRLAAEAGHAGAAKGLGLLYMTGAGVSRDPDEAAIWLRRAAEAGDEAARVDLAALIFNGRTNPLITKPAPVHEWFESAAEAGDLVGAFNYAVCLSQGFGVERDDARALAWFRRAAEGVVNAQYWVGRMLAEGRGCEANPEQARLWLQKAADLNVADAQLDLAKLYLDGAGGPRDHHAAQELYERAAAQGHPGAMFALGAMHGGGHDIAQDRAQALLWYRQGAEKGHPMAALMLGRYLAAGIACARDPAAARAFFAQALEAGIAEAQAELDTLEQAERDALALAELNAVEVEAPPAEAAE